MSKTVFAILNCSASIGDAADLLGQVVYIPVVKIDHQIAVVAVCCVEALREALLP